MAEDLETPFPKFKRRFGPRERVKKFTEKMENRVSLTLQAMTDAFIKNRKNYDLGEMDPLEEKQFFVDLQMLIQRAMGYDVCRHVDQTQLIAVCNLGTNGLSRKMTWRTQYLVACELSRIYYEMSENEITKEEAEALYSDQGSLGLSYVIILVKFCREKLGHKNSFPRRNRLQRIVHVGSRAL